MEQSGNDPGRCVEEYLRICKNEAILSEYFQRFEEEVRIMALRWITQEEAERMRGLAHAGELRELNEIIAADREITEKDREIEKLKKPLEEKTFPLYQRNKPGYKTGTAFVVLNIGGALL